MPEESESEVAEVVPERSPDLPMLSKDAWELIQFRMWDHLRSKMWTTLTIFLTLVTVGGLLGIPAYIGSRVDQKITEERAKFDQLRTQLEADRATAMAQSDIAAYTTLIWLQEIVKLQLELRAMDEAVQHVQEFEGGAAYFVRRQLLNKLERFAVGPERFSYDVRLFTKILEEGRLPESEISDEIPLTKDEWKAFGDASKKRDLRALPKLYELYSHVFALRSATLRQYQLALEPALSEPLRREKLYKQYGGSLYPIYQQTINGLYGYDERPSWLNEAADWSWLSPNAVSAFHEELQRIDRTDGDSK